MRLISIHLRNFRVHRDTRLKFQDGLTAITGSNESGKSSILEAIEWAIFGGPAVRGSVKGLRWRNAPARQPAYVELMLELGDTEYKVRRSETTAKVLSRSDATGPAWIQIADGTKGVTEYLAKRLGLSHAEFAATYMCKQKDVTQIATMRPAKRQEFIRRVMGAEKLDSAVQSARKEARDAEQRVRGMEALLGDGDALREALVGAQAYRDEASEAVEEVRANQQVAQKAYREAEDQSVALGKVKYQYLEAKGTLRRIREQMKDRKQWLGEHTSRRDEARGHVAELDQLDSLLVGHNARRLDLADMDATAKAIENIKRWEESLVHATEDFDVVEQSLASAREQSLKYDAGAHAEVRNMISEIRGHLTVHEEVRRDHVSTLKALIAADERMLKTLEKAAGDGECPTCGQALKTTEEIGEQTRKAHRGIELTRKALECVCPSEDELTARKRLEKAEETLEEHRNDKATAESESRNVDALRISLSNQSGRKKQLEGLIAKERRKVPEMYDSVTHGEMRKRVKADESMVERRRLLSPARKRLADTEKAIGGTREELVAIEAREREGELVLEAVNYSPGEHEKAEEARLKAGEHRDGFGPALVTAEKELTWAEGDVTRSRQKLEDHRSTEKQVRIMRGVVQLHTEVRDRLEAFRATALDSIKPDVAELVSGFLSYLTDGRHESVDVDDTFGVAIHEGGVEAPVVSGGTEDVAALATRIALSTILAERSGQPLGTIILDEPFGSLDTERRGRVLEILEQLSDVFPQVVMISHVEESREAADHVVSLEYDSNKGHTRVA